MIITLCSVCEREGEGAYLRIWISITNTLWERTLMRNLENLFAKYPNIRWLW